jgi:KipI family sensor histidine kinase inhibitor
MTRRLLGYGASALLLECSDAAEAARLVSPITRRFAAVSEIVPGARTLLLRLRSPLSPRERDELVGLDPDPSEQLIAEVVDIAVEYSGPDLAAVGELTGLDPDEVVRVHTGQLWTVAFCGFAPGFGYLLGENDRLRVPRRDEPRTVVPAGSVGLADVWSGVYPRSGPGGWQLIGSTTARLWDLDNPSPALLRPGIRVRFEALG